MFNSSQKEIDALIGSEINFKRQRLDHGNRILFKCSRLEIGKTRHFGFGGWKLKAGRVVVAKIQPLSKQYVNPDLQ